MPNTNKRKARKARADERAKRGSKPGPKGLRRRVKDGETSPKEALANLGPKADPFIKKWLIRKSGSGHMLLGYS